MAAPVPEQLMCLALVHCGAVDGCTASLVVDACDRHELASTDDPIREIAELEFSMWQGPGPDAVGSGSPVLVDDLWAETTRWPLFAERSRDRPVRGLVVLPLLVDGVGGLFAAYWREPHRCSTDELVALAAYGRALGVVAGRRLRASPAAAAWDSPIAAAVGMLMSYAEVSADDALELLRSCAFTADTTVSELSRRLVRGDLEPVDVV